jgi:alkylresorcinol/alkylpyrone synthase
MSTVVTPQIAAVAQALPPHRVEQDVILEALRALWATKHFNAGRIDQLHRSVKVGARHLALPIGEYPGLDSFQKTNDAWCRVALELGAEVVPRALDRAGLTPKEVDHFFFVTVTGIAVPSMESRIANRLEMSTHLKRSPLFGLGCAAGAAGIGRATDYLRGAPGEVALLLSVELCSLTLQREDLSIPNIIASGLFGDGAAAVVLSGGDRGGVKGPHVLRSRTVRYPNTERIMGWDMVDSGFKVILSAQVPQLVRENLPANVDAFLAESGLKRSDVRHWLCHTGGPKVIEAIESSLSLPAGALKLSWESLERVGNLSSASVLFVLDDFLQSGVAEEGDYGVLMAMGPGFGSELVLLRW